MKKFLSLLLCLMMFVSMFAVTAFADYPHSPLTGDESNTALWIVIGVVAAAAVAAIVAYLVKHRR